MCCGFGEKDSSPQRLALGKEGSMKLVLMIRIVRYTAIFFTLTALYGCYFANGIDYDEPALRYTSGHGQSIVEIRARPWHTGNAHFPFDFTVYKYDEVYEISIPRDVGKFTESDVELKVCGVSLLVKTAIVDVTHNSIKYEIEYNFRNRSTSKSKRISGSLRVENARATPIDCKKPTFYVKQEVSNLGKDQ